MYTLSLLINCAKKSSTVIVRNLPRGSAHQIQMKNYGLTTFAVGPAYHELMSDWVPSPNILMEDGLTHGEHKQQWKEQLSTLPSDMETTTREIAKAFIKSTWIPGTSLRFIRELESLVMGSNSRHIPWFKSKNGPEAVLGYGDCSGGIAPRPVFTLSYLSQHAFLAICSEQRPQSPAGLAGHAHRAHSTTGTPCLPNPSPDQV
jgi:hypothetical protein